MLVLTCNECGEPIDETGPFYTATVVEMNPPVSVGVPVMAPATTRLDWHVEHVPLPDIGKKSDEKEEDHADQRVDHG